MKKFLLLLLLCAVLIGTRFFYSSAITPSLTHDEMIYAANAASLAQFNRAFSKNTGWFSLSPVHHMYAEWTASLIAPFFWFIENPILATHALPGIMSLTLPFIFGLFLYGLFKDKKLSLIAIVLMSMSPLLIQFSKLTYDSFIALYLYLLGGAVFLNLKSKWRFLAIGILTLGFFNYQGYKLILFPWTLFLWLVSNIKKNWFIAAFGLTLTLFYGFVLLPNTASADRLQQTILTDIPKIEAITHSRRSISLLPTMGTYFANNIFSRAELGIDNFFGSIDPRMLFLRGEPAASGFAMYSHGFFYLIDGLMAIYGLICMFTSKKISRISFWYLAVTLTLLIPSITSTLSQWYLLRSLFFYIMLYGLISFGVKKAWENTYSKVFVGCGYLISFAFFSYQYFFQYPIARADASEFHERQVIEYAARASADHHIVVYDDEPLYLYMSHLLYKKTFAKTDTFESMLLDNILYTNSCQSENANDTIITSDIFDPCKDVVRNEDAVIVSLIDSGKKYTLTNDFLCTGSELGRYVRLTKLSDFNDLQADNQTFCTRFIVNQSM